jgi:putative flavoprotein involved in K+ transport
MVERIETIIVGGGQAGLAAGYCLGRAGRESLVLEQSDRPASAWRDDRWDSFTLVTPNWTVRLPDWEYQGSQPGGYMGKQELLNFFSNYAESSHIPLRYGIHVQSVEAQGQGYLVKAHDLAWQADHVIIATGFLQHPKRPAFAAQFPRNILQIPSGKYRNPDSLPPGAVLVVGSGQSGCQVADELYRAGRRVYLAVGSAGRVPRRYRGKDIYEWMVLTGDMSRTADRLPSPQARFQGAPGMTGKDGGRTLNLHQFFRDGVTLLGHLQGIQDGWLRLAQDLKDSLAKADANESDMLKAIDQYIVQNGLNAPEEKVQVLSDGYRAPLLERLDLKQAGISTVIWAMGYSFDYSLVKLPVVDEAGFPVTQRCATRYPGLYFLGQQWLTSKKSGLLLGVGEDAAMITAQIVDSPVKVKSKVLGSD